MLDNLSQKLYKVYSTKVTTKKKHFFYFFLVFEIISIWILDWIIYSQKFLVFGFILQFFNIGHCFLFFFLEKKLLISKKKKVQDKTPKHQLFLRKSLIKDVFLFLNFGEKNKGIVTFKNKKNLVAFRLQKTRNIEHEKKTKTKLLQKELLFVDAWAYFVTWSNFLFQNGKKETKLLVLFNQ